MHNNGSVYGDGTGCGAVDVIAFDSTVITESTFGFVVADVLVPATPIALPTGVFVFVAAVVIVAFFGTFCSN